MQLSVFLENEAATVNTGEMIGTVLNTGGVLYLDGNLGAGKTTLCRGVLRAFGHSGAVKSPTYTLVEPYELDKGTIYHFDLYRLGDPEELEFLGIRDYFSNSNVCLIEWPERGEGYIAEADIRLNLIPHAQGRKLTLISYTDYGVSVLTKLQKQLAVE